MNAVATLEDRLGRQPVVLAARAALATQRGAWVVGGALRDALLDDGGGVEDLDLVVAGPHAAEAARAIGKTASAPAFPLSEQFGAWRVVGDGWLCDITPMQGDGIENDLALRDFSVNAMALPLFGGRLVDPNGGLEDLDARALRIVAPDAFARDRLRPVRLVRFATELGFEPTPETMSAARASAPHTIEAAGERIFAELRRLNVVPR